VAKMDEDFDSFKWVDVEEIRELIRRERTGEKIVEPIYVALAELQGLVIIIYFFILTYNIEYNLSLFNIPALIVKSIVLPLLLSLPWLIIYYHGLSVWSYSYKILDSVLKRVGYFQRFFYFINAMFLYFLLIIPFATPPMSITSLILLLYFAINSAGSRKKKAILSVLLIPLFVFTFIYFIEVIFAIYFHFILDVLVPTFISYWVFNLGAIYTISFIFAAASSVGSFIRFIYEGAMQYDTDIVIPNRKIFAFQVVLTGALLLGSFGFNMNLSLIFMILISLSFVEWFLRKVKGLEREKSAFEEVVGTVGWIIYIVFLLIEIVRNIFIFNPLIQMVPISIAGLMFFILFIYSYKKAHHLLGEIREK